MSPLSHTQEAAAHPQSTGDNRAAQVIKSNKREVSMRGSVDMEASATVAAGLTGTAWRGSVGKLLKAMRSISEARNYERRTEVVVRGSSESEVESGWADLPEPLLELIFSQVEDLRVRAREHDQAVGTPRGSMEGKGQHERSPCTNEKLYLPL